MKASNIISLLQDIVKEHGDVDVTVDTEAAAYTVHLAETTGVYFDKILDSGCAYITLDHSVKIQSWEAKSAQPGKVAK